jgi:hydroxymethylpyrimidine/phosphomethylpyrimidine kinase
LIATVKHTIASQIRAVLDDIGTDALHSREVILTVTDVHRKYQCKNIIVDPVMAAISRDTSIKEDTIALLKQELFPLAKLITPNIPKAGILTGKKPQTMMQ